MRTAAISSMTVLSLSVYSKCCAQPLIIILLQRVTPLQLGIVMDSFK